jgi:hypothetical protein
VGAGPEVFIPLPAGYGLRDGAGSLYPWLVRTEQVMEATPFRVTSRIVEVSQRYRRLRYMPRMALSADKASWPMT